ncbi:MAG: DMT family protein [Acidobacteriota bacterium]
MDSQSLSEIETIDHEAAPAGKEGRWTLVVVPLMLFCSSAVMATAWIGHLQFKDSLSFLAATALAWLLVLPEYALNIKALRTGYPRLSGGQMGAIRLCTGVVCIALVSRYGLGEEIGIQKLLGFGLMLVGMLLVSDLRLATEKNEEHG